MGKEYPVIICGGEKGRAIIYGYVTEDPVKGKPVRQTRARMVIYYPSGGLFGLSAVGPPEGSRVSKAIPLSVDDDYCKQFQRVTPEAAKVFDEWK